jgi:hypothetical protein
MDRRTRIAIMQASDSTALRSNARLFAPSSGAVIAPGAQPGSSCGFDSPDRRLGQAGVRQRYAHG